MLHGGIGWLHVPINVISAPATNVCIGIAIDSMIHLSLASAASNATERKAGQPGRPDAKNTDAGSSIRT